MGIYSVLQLFFSPPRPLKAILAMSLSHPRVLEWYEVPRRVLQVTDSYFFGLLSNHKDLIPGIPTWFLLVCPVKDSCTSSWVIFFLTCQAVLSWVMLKLSTWQPGKKAGAAPGGTRGPGLKGTFQHEGSASSHWRTATSARSQSPGCSAEHPGLMCR